MSDMPDALLDGTMTCCRKCGRLAVFGPFKPQEIVVVPVWDEWRCGGCGTFNESPVREKAKEGAQ